MCVDGVIVASDSQVEFARGAPVKRVNANKVHRLLENRSIAIAGAGTLTFITKSIAEIRRSIKERERRENRTISLEEIIDIAESAVAAIYKTYNIERLRYLYGKPEEKGEEYYHHFTLVLGGVEDDEKRLCIIHEDGIAEIEETYATVGSGAAYAEYLLSKLYDKEIDVNTGKKLAIYVIKEVERMDPNVGGPVNVVILSRGKYEELTREEVERISINLLNLDDVVSKIYREIIMGRISSEDLEKFLARG